VTLVGSRPWAPRVGAASFLDRRAVTMPVTDVLVWCDCDHALDAHRSNGGPCTHIDSYGYKCECRSFEPISSNVDGDSR
jgi:hypothetical protein